MWNMCNNHIISMCSNSGLFLKCKGCWLVYLIQGLTKATTTTTTYTTTNDYNVISYSVLLHYKSQFHNEV